MAQPPGPGSGPGLWPPAFPYQDPAPHPYSSPHLHQLPAKEGGDDKGSWHSEGDPLPYPLFNPPPPLNRSSDSSQQEVTAVRQMTVTTQDVGRLDQSGPDRKQALCFMKRPPSVTTGLAAQTRSTLPRAAAATFPRPRSPSC